MINIDIYDLISSKKDKLNIDVNINIEKSELEKTAIKELKNVTFFGYIEKIIDDEYNLIGTLSGTMVLADDITLELIDYPFSIEIDENISENDEKNENNLKIMQNTIDILPILWQNIIVEIPLKFTSHSEVDLKGDGWRLITEEEYEKEKSNSSPFSNLEELLNERKE